MLTAQKNIVDRVAHLEKSVLGCLVEFCSRGSATELDARITSGLAADQFTTSDHRAIFRAMVELRNEGKIPDEPSLIEKLDDRAMAQVRDFTKGVVPENLVLRSRLAQGLAGSFLLEAAGRACGPDQPGGPTGVRGPHARNIAR